MKVNKETENKIIKNKELKLIYKAMLKKQDKYFEARNEYRMIRTHLVTKFGNIIGKKHLGAMIPRQINQNHPPSAFTIDNFIAAIAPLIETDI